MRQEYRSLAQLIQESKSEEPQRSREGFRRGPVTAALISGARFGCVVGGVIASVYALVVAFAVGYAFFTHDRKFHEIVEIGILQAVLAFVVIPLASGAVGGGVAGGIAAIGSLFERLSVRFHAMPADDADGDEFS